MIADALATVLTTIFLLVVLSYYLLFLIRHRKRDYKEKFSSITIIVPAHNEAPYIAACLASIKAATFAGKKQIIVVDDASADATAAIARKAGVIVLRNAKHSGKSFSINKALKRASGDLIAIVDADSVIAKDALVQLASELARENMAGAAGVVRCENRTRFLNIWVHLELLYSSLIRSLFAKVNANVVTPGALSMYRASALREIGGFSTKGFSEDMDVAVRLIRQGYHIGFADGAISSTNMPDDVKGFIRQRTRIARGLIYFLKQHLRVNTTIIDLYTLPLFVFQYVQAVIMGGIAIWKIVSGYLEYFVAKGIYFSPQVLKFFFEWLSIVGYVKWSYAILTGVEPLTFGAAVGVAATFLTYPLYLYAILKYDRKVDLLHLFTVFFMFPFWLLLMVIYAICLPEIFRAEQYNRWKKNE